MDGARALQLLLVKPIERERRYERGRWPVRGKNAANVELALRFVMERRGSSR